MLILNKKEISIVHAAMQTITTTVGEQVETHKKIDEEYNYGEYSLETTLVVYDYEQLQKFESLVYNAHESKPRLVSRCINKVLDVLGKPRYIESFYVVDIKKMSHKERRIVASYLSGSKLYTNRICDSHKEILDIVLRAI